MFANLFFTEKTATNQREIKNLFPLLCPQTPQFSVSNARKKELNDAFFKMV